MRIVAQRVSEAKVIVEGKQISSIGRGLVLLVAIGKGDSDDDINYLVRKIKNLRIFEDGGQKFNLDIMQVKGEILSIPQFTLYADTRKGARPSFDEAQAPQIAQDMWKEFNARLRAEGISLKEGVFAARMQVHIVNEGPVTIFLNSRGKA
ncbi:MAG: D-aminoacyl-tRNA deacylase [Candidatus Omnitrophota bacterium]